jgi:1-deoxy-D-xylulose-5-phosphate synthase
MAKEGLLPFCNIYSTFMQRAYDQVIHDVALQKLPVVFCLDRGGLVGEDGETHHGVFDLAYLRNIPNMIVSAPMDEIELRNIMYTAQLRNNGPFSIRYPRGRGIYTNWKSPFEEIEIGKARKLKNGQDLAVLSIGFTGVLAQKAIDKAYELGFDVAHYDMRFVKPIDEKTLIEVLNKYEYIITVEDGVLQGGFGSAILEFMSDNNYTNKVTRLGVPDKFIVHGTQAELRKLCNFDEDAIFNSIINIISEKNKLVNNKYQHLIKEK